MTAFARRFSARTRRRMVDKARTGFFALALPAGAPQRQFGFLPPFAWGVVCPFPLIPLPLGGGKEQQH